MAVNSMEEQLGDLARLTLESLADPADEVTYGVRLSDILVECEHDGEPVTALTPCVSLCVALSCPEYSMQLAGTAEMPIGVAIAPDAFAHGVEILWSQIQFRRIAMSLGELDLHGQQIIDGVAE